MPFNREPGAMTPYLVPLATWFKPRRHPWRGRPRGEYEVFIGLAATIRASKGRA